LNWKWNQALLKQLGGVAKIAKSVGPDSICVGDSKIDTSKIGKVDGGREELQRNQAHLH
jgi:hypothetical protein